MDIADWRKKIDELDVRLVELLSEARPGCGRDWAAEERHESADLRARPRANCVWRIFNS